MPPLLCFPPGPQCPLTRESVPDPDPDPILAGGPLRGDGEAPISGRSGDSRNTESCPCKSSFLASPYGRRPPASCWEGPSTLFPTHRALGGLNSREGCDPYFVSIWLPKRGLLCFCFCFCFCFQKGKKDSPTFHLCLPGALAGVGVLGAGPLLVTEALGPSPE